MAYSRHKKDGPSLLHDERPGYMKWLPVILALFAVGLYAVTLRNGYVLDDRLVITENNYVKQGAKGIHGILTKDSFVSLYEDSEAENSMQGGRYRPLSLVTFALETEVFGESGTNLSFAAAKLGDLRNPLRAEERIAPPWVGHLGNILIFGLIAVAGFYALRRLFPDEEWAAFLGMLIFIAHPLNTEVVANIKSRDELLSLLFMLLVICFGFRHILLASLAALLAVFSKEYGLLLIVLIPLLAWVERPKAWRFWLQWIGIAMALSGYVAVRLHYVPFHATTSLDLSMDGYTVLQDDQTTILASKLHALGYYLKLMVAPYPLQYSYAYAQIPFVGPTSPWLWASVGAYILLALTALKLSVRRQATGFLIFFALGTLFMVSNLVFSAANIVAERLAFHATWAMMGVVGWCISRWGNNFFYAAGLLGLLVMSTFTVMRSMDWKTMETLYIVDGEKAPNCAIIQTNAGAKWLDRYFDAQREGASEEEMASLLDRAHRHTLYATSTYSYDAVGNLNLTRIRIERGELNLAVDSLKVVNTVIGHHPRCAVYKRMLGQRLYTRGVARWRELLSSDLDPATRAKQVSAAQEDLKVAATLYPSDPDIWYYLYGGYIEEGNPEAAKKILPMTKNRVWRGFIEKKTSQRREAPSFRFGAPGSPQPPQHPKTALAE